MRNHFVCSLHRMIRGCGKPSWFSLLFKSDPSAECTNLCLVVSQGVVFAPALQQLLLLHRPGRPKTYPAEACCPSHSCLLLPPPQLLPRPTPQTSPGSAAVTQPPSDRLPPGRPSPPLLPPPPLPPASDAVAAADRLMQSRSAWPAPAG